MAQGASCYRAAQLQRLFAAVAADAAPALEAAVDAASAGEPTDFDALMDKLLYPPTYQLSSARHSRQSSSADSVWRLDQQSSSD